MGHGPGRCVLFFPVVAPMIEGVPLDGGAPSSLSGPSEIPRRLNPMKNLSRLLLLAGLAGFTGAHAEDKAPAATAPVAPVAAAPKPTIGNDAPEFKPTAWIQGEPVTAYEKGKVYIIECWATWCGPCVAMIPHLNDLHKKFADKGLVVIGTNVWDKDKANAEAFVTKKGEAMSYRVAYDDRATGSVSRDWLQATGVRGIPHAFAVRDGKVLWVGHPAGLSDTLVTSMLDGTFDTAKAEAEQKANEAKAAKIKGIQGEIAKFKKEKNFEAALKKVDELDALLGARSKPQMDFQRAVITANINVADGVAKMAKIVAENKKVAGAQYEIGKALLQAPFKGDKGAATLALECATNLRAASPGARSEAFYKKAAAAAGVSEGGAEKPAGTETK